MSKRRSSPEAEIVRFFHEAEPLVALMLFRIVRGILDTRGCFKATTASGRPAAGRARRKAPPPPVMHGSDQ